MRRVSSIAITLFVAGLWSCGSEDMGRGPLKRTPLGKADGSYSCSGLCGDKAPGGCFCDDKCETFGDCCPDKKSACDGVTPSCAGACGFQSVDGCWCDELCENYGDCCADRVEVCLPAGCTDNSQCAEGEYCFADSCLSDGAQGTCRPLPEKCVMVDKPVCGCDGETYFNTCVAHLAGVNKDYAGECVCGGPEGKGCPAGQKCKLPNGDALAEGQCVPEAQCDTVIDCMGLVVEASCDGAWRCVESQCQFECGHEIPTCHVGGCSGQLCTPLEGMATTCEYLDWYECFQYSTCGNFTPDGSCGWEANQVYVDCLATHGLEACDLEADPAKSYVLKDVEKCKVAKFSCSLGRPFFDQCGCGCLQE